MKRLFWGFRLSSEIHDRVLDSVAKMKAVASERYASTPVRIDWVPLDRFHVTLQYLGPTDEAKMPSIIESGRRICGESRKFEVSARGFGVFPNDSHPKVIWARVIDDPSENLQKLADTFWKEMQVFSNKPEHYPFKAHLTVARVREARGVGEILFPVKALTLGKALISEVVLFESVLDENGHTVEYREVEKISLG